MMRSLSGTTWQIFWLPWPPESLDTATTPHSSSFLIWVVSAPLVMWSFPASSFMFMGCSTSSRTISSRTSEPSALNRFSPSLNFSICSIGLPPIFTRCQIKDLNYYSKNGQGRQQIFSAAPVCGSVLVQPLIVGPLPVLLDFIGEIGAEHLDIDVRGDPGGQPRAADEH